MASKVLFENLALSYSEADVVDMRGRREQGTAYLLTEYAHVYILV